jgi:hypothetical protein
VLFFACKKPTSHKAYHDPWESENIIPSWVSLASTLCTQGLFLPLLQVHFEQVCLVWRILLMGTDGFSSLPLDVILLPLLIIALWTSGIVITVSRLCVVWNGLSIVSLYSLLDPGWKIWSVRVLPSGVLDGIIWCSSLSGLLVPSGRQAPWKCAKLGDSAT